jgi:hypothetical protein
MPTCACRAHVCLLPLVPAERLHAACTVEQLLSHPTTYNDATYHVPAASTPLWPERNKKQQRQQAADNTHHTDAKVTGTTGVPPACLRYYLYGDGGSSSFVQSIVSFRPRALLRPFFLIALSRRLRVL